MKQSKVDTLKKKITKGRNSNYREILLAYVLLFIPVVCDRLSEEDDAYAR